MKTFLTVCHNYDFEKNPVIIFTAKEYPVLFFSRLIERLRLVRNFDFKFLAHDAPLLEVQVQLQTTFLGQASFFWCGSLSSFDNTLRKKYCSFFSSYYGPHVVWAFIEDKDLKDQAALFNKTCIVNLDDSLSTAQWEQLFTLLFDTVTWSDVYHLTREKYKVASLDVLVMLGQYRLVLGKNTTRFMQEWLESILAPQESLFTLAQYFFARKPSHFFRMWKKIRHNYDTLFWVAFWSEQVWRAYYVITFIKKNQLTLAKQMAFRLPFSFLQRDWKGISQNDLSIAHALLYEGDFRIKNGGSDLFLDLFFARHFLMYRTCNR